MLDTPGCETLGVNFQVHCHCTQYTRYYCVVLCHCTQCVQCNVHSNVHICTYNVWVSLEDLDIIQQVAFDTLFDPSLIVK